MLRYWFNFKETRQITALQKLLRLYWMQIGMCLPKFDIYQVTAAPICFISHENSWLPDFFFFNFSDVGFDIHPIQRDIVSAGQSVYRLNNYRLNKYRFSPEFRLNNPCQYLKWRSRQRELTNDCAGFEKHIVKFVFIWVYSTHTEFCHS